MVVHIYRGSDIAFNPKTQTPTRATEALAAAAARATAQAALIAKLEEDLARSTMTRKCYLQ